MHIQVGTEERGVSNAEIAQHLREFSLVADFEVFGVRLPELHSGVAELPGGLLLYHSHGMVRAFRIGLAAHNVHVFGHEDVAKKKKLMAAEGGGENSSRVIVIAVCEPVITAGGEKVVAELGLVLFQVAGDDPL
jgi:hypothetical protein